MKISEFRQKIVSWEDKYKNQPALETYLSALWKLLNQKRNEGPSLSLFASILESSFESSPATFQQEWLIYREPAEYEEEHYSEEESWNYLKKTLLFQIADLRGMKGKQLDNEFKEMGVISDTGHSWYNFMPTIYLECGTALLDDETEINETEEVSWLDLESILEMGRIYE